MYPLATKNIVEFCLKLNNQDKVVIITDKQRERIGQEIALTSSQIATTKLFVVENFTARPARQLPNSLVKEITSFAPTVSVYTATGQMGELAFFREPLLDLLTETLKCRHAHMINIDEQIMQDGMSVDARKVFDITHKLYGILEGAKEIKVTCPYGTDLSVELSENLKWKADDGVPEGPGKWCNLPGGEVFTCPQKVDGTVIGWELGDYFSQKYGLLEKPVKMVISNSRITKIEGDNIYLIKELTDYLHTYENSNRVGEFAIGCLLGLKRLIGNFLQDEKFPGVHMAFGHPYPEQTGQTEWDAPTHVDIIPLTVSVWVDGKQILDNGEFTIDLDPSGR